MPLEAREHEVTRNWKVETTPQTHQVKQTIK